MKILIDGDSCRVIRVTEQIAKKYNIPCHIFCDSAHALDSTYSEIKIVSTGHNAADFAIINQCGINDIVITNDSGLAAMVLAKRGIALQSNGVEYTQKNISEYLNRRYVRTRAQRKTNRNQVKGRLYDNKNIIKTSYKTTLMNIIEKQVLTGVTV